MQNSKRETILAWVKHGHIAEHQLGAALREAGVYPARAEWVRFLGHLLLWSGAVLLAAAVIFFLAYNWRVLGRFGKFAVAEIPLLLAFIFAAWRGTESALGRAALFAAALFTGGLLALVGQTYQTGADTFELFATWAVAILPWVGVARMPALWLFWLLLANTAIMLYFQLRPGIVDGIFATARPLWALFLFNTLAWAVWEAAALRLSWMRQRWLVRSLAALSSAQVTMLANDAIFGEQNIPGIIAWLMWITLAYAVYRRRIYELFVLACGVLSTVIVVTSVLVKILISGKATDVSGFFLLIAMAVVGISGAGAWWLKKVSAEQRS